MTDRLQRLEDMLPVAGITPDHREVVISAGDYRWLVAELQETRRLGNQLADAIVGDVYYAGQRIQVQISTGSAIGAAVTAWRDHQKDNPE